MTVFNDNVDSSDDVLVWRPIRYAMAAHRRVLVVDDYREAADALQMLLMADGFECRALDDPFAVCETAREWQPFAVVLDIKMPGLDGLELARRLRAHPQTSHMPRKPPTDRIAYVVRSVPGDTIRSSSVPMFSLLRLYTSAPDSFDAR